MSYFDDFEETEILCTCKLCHKRDISDIVRCRGFIVPYNQLAGQVKTNVTFLTEIVCNDCFNNSLRCSPNHDSKICVKNSTMNLFEQQERLICSNCLGATLPPSNRHELNIMMSSVDKLTIFYK